MSTWSEKLQYGFSVAFRPAGRLLEKAYLRSPRPLKWAPVFVIGPARSGTTLVFQCLVQGLHFAFLSNLASYFPSCPGVVTRWAAGLGSCRPPSSFTSSHGRISGWNSPNQGHVVWSRWFVGPGAYTGSLRLSETDRKEMRGVIGMIETACAAPFIAKWPGFSVEMSTLAELFPEAVFVRVRRDHLQVARSVLKARRDLTGDPRRTISRLPSGYEPYLERDYIEQTCAYVLGVEADIDRDTELIGTERFFEIPYERLCAAPREFVAELSGWYHELCGYRLETRCEIPSQFTCSVGRKIGEEDYHRLEQRLKTMSMDSGDTSFA